MTDTPAGEGTPVPSGPSVSRRNILRVLGFGLGRASVPASPALQPSVALPPPDPVASAATRMGLVHGIKDGYGELVTAVEKYSIATDDFFIKKIEAGARVGRDHWEKTNSFSHFDPALDTEAQDTLNKLHGKIVTKLTAITDTLALHTGRFGDTPIMIEQLCNTHPFTNLPLSDWPNHSPIVPLNLLEKAGDQEEAITSELLDRIFPAHLHEQLLRAAVIRDNTRAICRRYVQNAIPDGTLSKDTATIDIRAAGFMEHLYNELLAKVRDKHYTTPAKREWPEHSMFTPAEWEEFARRLPDEVLKSFIDRMKGWYPDQPWDEYGNKNSKAHREARATGTLAVIGLLTGLYYLTKEESQGVAPSTNIEAAEIKSLTHDATAGKPIIGEFSADIVLGRPQAEGVLVKNRGNETPDEGRVINR